MSALKQAKIKFDAERIARDQGLVETFLPWLIEYKRRKDHPFTKYIPDDHEDRNQLAFHTSTRPTRLVFGGNQVGKSYCLAREIAWWLTETHPYRKTPKSPRIYVVSAEYRTVQEGIWRHLKEILPEWLVLKYGKWMGGEDIPYFIHMHSGGRLNFISGQGVEDARKKLQAVAIDLIVFDEEVSGILWEEAQPRLLAKDGEAVIGATLYCSEEWILNLEDRAISGDAGIGLFRFQTKRAVETGHISKRKYEDMLASLSEEDRAVRLEGKSRRSQGLVYQEFTSKNVVAPFNIPRSWTRYCALDPGWRTFAVLWGAVSPDDKIVLYREMYYHGVKYKDIAERIFAAEGLDFDMRTKTWIWNPNQSERIAIHWIDPSGFGHHESGEMKVGHLLGSYGLMCSPARNDVDAGIETCRASLMDGIDGVPRVRVFSTCLSFLREIRTYRHQRDTKDSTKSERGNTPIGRNDHLMDAWKYLMLGGMNYLEQESEEYASVRSMDLERNMGSLGSKTMDVVLKEEWRRLMSRKKNESKTQHVGGLGSEY
jgi:hypothetical protein